MYNFILQTIIMVSLAVVIYLFARAVPRVKDSPVSGRSRDYLGEFFDRLPLEKADAFVTALLERFLRNLKVVILKTDNLLTEHLKGLREVNTQGKNQAVGELFSSGEQKSSEPVENKDKSDNLNK